MISPSSIGFFIQLLGRVCRMDSTYDAQNMYLLEVKDTVDTYKRMLIQDHTATINAIFGKGEISLILKI